MAAACLVGATSAWAQGNPPSSAPEVIDVGAPADAHGEPASAPATVVSGPTQGIDAREILSQSWFQYQGLRQRGANREAAALVEAVLGFMQREGLQAAPEIAAAFLAEGKRALSNGEGTRGVEAYRLAVRFDPGLPAARFALATALLWQEHDILGGLRSFKDGLLLSLTDPESIFQFAGWAITLIYLGALWGTGLTLTLFVLRCSPALSHDVQERMGGRSGEVLAPLLAGAILAGPLVLPVPLFWVLAFWAAVIYAYAEGAERGVLVGSLLALLLVGPFGAALAWDYDTATDPVARALLQAARAGADLRHVAALRQITEERPNDPVYPFLLASAYRVGGHFDEAMAMYAKVLAIDPANARAMVNLGNLHALRQEFAKAQGLYQKASEADPRMILGHYNSHLAHLETFNMEAADEELKRARQVDDIQVTRLVAQAGDGTSKRVPLDSYYPTREIWSRALRLRNESGTGKEALRSLLHPASLAGGVGLLAALLLPGLLIAPRSGGARRCRRCGRAFCRRCQVISRFPDNCSPCVHLFILKDGVAPSVRDRKKQEVVSYRRRAFVVTRLASLLVPGSGHVLAGRPVLGVLLLSAWSAAGLGLALHGRLLVAPGALQSGPVGGGMVWLLLLALLAWLTANLAHPDVEAG
jgi:tetratricopeptide (TPR) repeat protein